MGRLRGITLISGVLFLAITLAATVIIYFAAVPVIQKVRDAAITEQTTQAFLQIDELIREVAAGGKGTKRTFTLSTQAGTFDVNDATDTVSWSYETDSQVISPRTQRTIGNLIVGSNLDVAASRTTYQSANAWLLENQHLKVYINRSGDSAGYVNWNTNQVVLALYQKDIGQWLNDSSMLSFAIENSTGATGNGYTVAEREGNSLAYGRVTFLLNNSYRQYYVNFTLESGADFLTITPYL